MGVAPFHLAPEPVPLVQVDIDGSGPLRFLVDTGAVDLTVDDRVARDIGITAGDDEHPGYSGVGGPYVAKRGVVSSFRVADTELRDVQVTISDLTDLSLALSCSVDGILGYPAFADRRVSIDYPRRRFGLEDSHEGGGTLRFRLASRAPVPLIDVDIDGNRIGPLVVDTGSSVMVLSEAAARDLTLDLVVDHRAGYGDPKDFPHWWAQLGQVSVGSYSVPNLECIVYDTAPFAAALREDLAGVVGTPFLKSFDLTLDYGTHHWSLRRDHT